MNKPEKIELILSIHELRSMLKAAEAIAEKLDRPDLCSFYTLQSNECDAGGYPLYSMDKGEKAFQA